MSRRMEREGLTTAERVRASRSNPQRVSCPPHFTLRALAMLPPMRAHHATALEGAAVYRRWLATMRNPLEAGRRARGLASARGKVSEAAAYRIGAAVSPYRAWAPLP